MRKIGTAIGLLVCLASCDVNKVNEMLGKPLSAPLKGIAKNVAEPVQKEFDFGEMKLGDSIEHVFELRNTGSLQVIIQDVKASCGCTTVDWMKSPIAPGKTGWIKSSLKAVDKGHLRKSVVARLNTPDPFVVFYLSGQVTSADTTTMK